MAKAPTEQTYFDLGFHCPVDKLGVVVSILHRLDITDVRHTLVTSVARFAKNQKRKAVGGKKKQKQKRKARRADTQAFTIAEIKRLGPKVKLIDLTASFVGRGQTDKAAASAITRLMANKLVKRVGIGVYQLTAKGQAQANGEAKQ